jgi:hypothetical protein
VLFRGSEGAKKVKEFTLDPTGSSLWKKGRVDKEVVAELNANPGKKLEVCASMFAFQVVLVEQV